MKLEKRLNLAFKSMELDGLDMSFVPANITDRLVAFSVSIGASAVLNRVPVEPFDWTRNRRCFDNCTQVVKVMAGTLIHGWAWHQVCDLFIVAEFHGVWRSPSGQLIDITPPSQPRKETVFSEDPIRTAPDVRPGDIEDADRHAEPNRRFALKDVEDVHEWIAAEEANEVLRNRKSNGETVPLAEVVMAMERNANARYRIMKRVHRSQKK